jgi:hypothetical protein
VNLDGILATVRLRIAGLRGKREREAIESPGRLLAEAP